MKIPLYKNSSPLKMSFHLLSNSFFYPEQILVKLQILDIEFFFWKGLLKCQLEAI